MAQEKKYDIFISYSRKDFEEVNAFVEMLKQRIPTINIWFDIDGIESGDEFDEKIIDAIENSLCVMFALSDNSLQSQWTKDEVMYAKNMGIRVVPILMAGARPKGWFMFKFGRVDYIDSTSEQHVDKLLHNLSSWTMKAISATDMATPVIKPTTQSMLNAPVQATPTHTPIPKTISEEIPQTAVSAEHSPTSTENEILMEFTVKGVSFDMIRVAGGTFTMGATAEQENDADNEEKPAHKVNLSDFYIGETTVTQKLWQAVMGNNPSHFHGRKNPVENVSWEDCQMFIAKLNELTGQQFRLPTEAEWEYAARGGNQSKGFKYAGSNTLSDVAWFKETSSGTTHPVMTKQPNELGLYDMSGNVWEWCQDWGGRYPNEHLINPLGPEDGSCRINRGGAWLSDAWKCRVSVRYDDPPEDRFNYMGLRLALDDNPMMKP